MMDAAAIEVGIQGLQSDNAKIRDQYFFDLLAISESAPENLYAAWDVFADLLRKPEVTKKYAAILLLSNVVKVDKENKFDRIYEEFYQLITHESPVVSPHIAASSGKIIRAKPHLQEKILSLLLNIEKVNECRHPDLMMSYVIQAFDDCFDVVQEDDRKNMIHFVVRQKDSKSPKTKKKAREFIKKWDVSSE